MEPTLLPPKANSGFNLHSLNKLIKNIGSETVQINFVHYVCLFIICINPLLGFINFWNSHTIYGIISLTALILLVLNKSGYFKIARLGLLVGINLMIFATSASIGSTNIVYLCFAISIIIALVVYNKKEIWQKCWSIAISILVVTISIVSGYKFPEIATNNDNPFDASYYINIICILISVIVALYYLFLIYEKSELHLRLLIKELQTQDQAIQEQNAQLILLNTNLLRSQDELLKNEAFLNTIIDHIPVMLTVKDTKNLQFVRVNKAVLELTKYEEKELLKKNNFSIFPQEQAHKVTENDIKVLHTGLPIEQEEYLTDKKNKTHIVNTKRVPVFSLSGEIIYLLSIGEDVTQRKRSEQVLNNTLEELRVRNNELDNYVYRVSHDLRSPLCSIQGLINLLKGETDIQIIQEYAQMIEQTVIKSDFFIQSILDHSKMLHADLQVTEVDLKKLFLQCYQELKYIINFQDIKFVVNQSGSFKFYNDEFRLTTVIRNLISNSLKYNNNSDAYIVCDIEINENQAIINIEDNGIGIEEKYINRIYDMFFRGTVKSSGSGLGLYIVKQTLDKLDATVSIKSKEGIGTQVRITIPNKKRSYLLL